MFFDAFVYMVIIKTENRRPNNIQKTSPQSYKTQIKILLFPGQPGPGATLLGWPKAIFHINRTTWPEGARKYCCFSDLMVENIT